MKKILKFIPLTITVTAVIAFVYYSVRNFEKTLIENSLMKIEPIILAVTFIGILSFIFLNRKEIIPIKVTARNIGSIFIREFSINVFSRFLTE